MSEKPYTITPVEKLPESRMRSKYEPLLTEFLESSMQIGLLEYPGKKRSSLSSGLNSIIKHRKLPITVTMRQGKVYLVKTKTE